MTVSTVAASLPTGNAFEIDDLAPDMTPLDAADAEMVRQMEGGQPGLLIAAPPRVIGRPGAQLPLVGVRVASLEEAAQSNLRSDAIVAAVCLTTHRVFTAMAFAEPTDLPPVSEDEGPKPEGLCGTTFEIDALERLSLPSRPGRYLLALLLHERVSNTVVVELGPPPGTFHDPEVERELAARLLREGPRPPWPEPDPKRARYTAGPHLPARPDTGVALESDRVIVLESGAQWTLRGSFRLPLLPHELSTSSGSMRAVMTITLVATGSRRARPWVCPLAVPVYEVERDESGRIVGSGQFAIDLFALLGLHPMSETVWIRALHGVGTSSAVATALVDAAQVYQR